MHGLAFGTTGTWQHRNRLAFDLGCGRDWMQQRGQNAGFFIVHVVLVGSATTQRRGVAPPGELELIIRARVGINQDRAVVRLKLNWTLN